MKSLRFILLLFICVANIVVLNLKSVLAQDELLKAESIFRSVVDAMREEDIDKIINCFTERKIESLEKSEGMAIKEVVKDSVNRERRYLSQTEAEIVEKKILNDGRILLKVRLIKDNPEWDPGKKEIWRVSYLTLKKEHGEWKVDD